MKESKSFRFRVITIHMIACYQDYMLLFMESHIFVEESNKNRSVDYVLRLKHNCYKKIEIQM
jgi:hypothetical protein